MKKYLICMVMCFALIVSATNVFAAKFSNSIPEDLNIDASETYTKGEHPMIPLRKTLENLGYEVVWNGEEMSVDVSNENVNIKIFIGKDSYYIKSDKGVGMSVPVMVGAAPELKDDKTYVPAVMVTMLRHYNNLSEQQQPTKPSGTGKISFGVSSTLNIDASETYKSGEHTMVPVRKAAENLGYEVTWNGDEKSVFVSNDKVSIKIYVGLDSYYVDAPDGAGMSNEAILGTAPEMKEGTVYVPAAMFNLLSLYNVKA